MTKGENSSGGFKKPPYRYVEGNVDFAMLLETAGLDADIYGTRDFLRDRGLWALIELFSDGELRILAGDDAVNNQTERQRQGGERYGEFYDNMARLRTAALAEGGTVADEVNRLARFCGTSLAESVVNGVIQLPDLKLVQPSVSAFDGKACVRFDEYEWHSARDEPVLLEYGPGVSGKKFLETQLAALQYGLQVFQYIGVSDGPFVNQFLTTYLYRKLEILNDPNVLDIATGGELFIGREDGMQQATGAILATPQPSGTHELCDLILLTAVHMADPAELEYVLAQSPEILRPDGKLMLSAPLHMVKEKMTTFDQLLCWAQQGGYTIEWQKAVNTGDHSLNTATVSGLAVLHK